MTGMSAYDAMGAVEYWSGSTHVHVALAHVSD